MSTSKGQAAAAQGQESSRVAAPWRRFAPYAGTLIIFAVIFWGIPIGKVGVALEHIPIGKFVGLFLPFSIAYWLIDSYCLTWVVRRFNAPMRWRDILPIRASMYLPALINTNLGQGGVAWYLREKAAIPFIEALSSILFIALMEIYQLFLFSTAGVIFYRPGSAGQREIVAVLRVAYVIAWAVFAGIIILFAVARRSERMRERIGRGRFGAIGRTFLEARPRDYGIVIGIKAPGFLLSIVTQYVALSLYGIAIPFAKLTLFLPLVFLAAALPVAVAHLGTSQAAWLLFFSRNASNAQILAYSLAAHFTFMFCNGLIGLCFLPRAIRELSGVERAA
jgi:Lysylphosphatidylglycerol synthase TM region